jgi:hypothetical protein
LFFYQQRRSGVIDANLKLDGKLPCVNGKLANNNDDDFYSAVTWHNAITRALKKIVRIHMQYKINVV